MISNLKSGIIKYRIYVFRNWGTHEAYLQVNLDCLLYHTNFFEKRILKCFADNERVRWNLWGKFSANLYISIAANKVPDLLTKTRSQTTLAEENRLLFEKISV